MKKNYITPILQQVEVCPTNLMATSNIPLSREAAEKDYAGGGDAKEEQASSLWDEAW